MRPANVRLKAPGQSITGTLILGPPRIRLTAILAQVAIILAAHGEAVGASPAPDTLNSRAPAPTSPIVQEIRVLIDRGRYAPAESLAARQLARPAPSSRADSLEVATMLDLLLTARARTGARVRQEWTRPAREAVDIKERTLPPDDPEIATSLNRLASLLADTGHYDDAKPLFDRALKIREKALGPNHPKVAEVLINLAISYRDAGNWIEARPLYQRAVSIWDKALGSDFSLAAQSVNSLVDHFWNSGDYAGARMLYERAMSVWEKAVSPEHPEVGLSLRSAASLMQGSGDWASAWPFLEQGLNMYEAALGADHPDVALSIHGLAALYQSAGEPAIAQRLYRRALAAWERSLGPNHPDLALTLNNLADVVETLGDYDEARRLLERAIGIRRNALGPDHPYVATSLNGLAELLASAGDFEEAEAYCRQALAIREQTLPEYHPDIAASLSLLGGLRLSAGDTLKARALLERALEIREKSLGPDQIDVALILQSLGNLLQETGDTATARRYFDRVLEIREKALGVDHPSVASVLYDLAGLDFADGFMDQARARLGRALATAEKVLGADHPQVAWPLAALARVQMANGETRAALDTALRAETISRDHLRLTVSTLPERQALRYASVRASGLNVALSLAAGGLDPESRRKVWDALLRSRAVVLDEVAGRHRRVSKIIRCNSQLNTANARYASLQVRGVGQDPPEVYRHLLDEARRHKEDVERSLNESCVGFREEQARIQIGFSEVAVALHGGSALVSFARYNQLGAVRSRPPKPDLEEVGRSSRGPRPPAVPSYLIFVLPAGSKEATVVTLGPAAEIDTLVSRWVEEAGRGALTPRRKPLQAEAACRAAGEALRRRVWDAIAPLVQGAKRVFVVPDGSLNLVNLASLPAGDTAYLLETDPLIHYLSAERDLVPAETPTESGEGLLAIGGPAFDDGSRFSALRSKSKVRGESPAPEAAGEAAYRGEHSGCAEFRTIKFEPLLAAAREAEEIAALWRKGSGGKAEQGHNSELVELIGTRATEAAFKERAPGKQMLHLATHGFFLSGRCASVLESGRGIGGLAAAPAIERRSFVGENPLLLSGLAMAGANWREAAKLDEDDGILTAEEIAALDLSGVDWAVLSACETGVGEVRAGEGVFGLRRAFQVAGASTLIMSLWAVEDESARQWMKKLYEGRLVKHLGTAEAVREASLAVLRERRAKGESTHPFYWGAFVAAGDWR